MEPPSDVHPAMEGPVAPTVSQMTEKPAEAENTPPVETLQADAGGTTTEDNIDPNLVTWDGPNDPSNPKNWPFAKRWRITALASSFTFLSSLPTSMIAPALLSIGRDLGIQRSSERQLTLSVFILAYGFGPLLAGPLSEMYGRPHVLQLLNLFYVVFNAACGFAQNGTQLIVCRFFAGFGGSAATVIGAGVLADVWSAEERGLSMSIYTSITLLGPSIGPLLGGFITQYSSWRWNFWSVSIANLVLQAVAVLFLRETHAPIILGRKAAALRKQTANPALHTKWQQKDTTSRQRMLEAFSRPAILFFTQPICFVLSMYFAYVFGLTYLTLATYAELWIQRYHESVSISGLNYLSLAIGYTVGIQTCARLSDVLRRRLTVYYGGAPKPEYRLPLMLPGVILLPAGMLWYGWSAQHHLPWIMPDIGVAIFAIGTKYTTQAIQLYAIDVYPTYTASASAVAQFVRALAGFAFPLFGPYLYGSLGYGWGNSVLALIAIVMGIVIPPLLWIYGPVMRKKSPYCAG